MNKSDYLRRRLHVDAEGFQKLRRHDVETDGELQLDQRRRRQLCRDRIEGGVGRTAQRDDFIGEGERRALQIVKAGGGFQFSSAAFCSSVTPTSLPLRLCATTS